MIFYNIYITKFNVLIKGPIKWLGEILIKAARYAFEYQETSLAPRVDIFIKYTITIIYDFVLLIKKYIQTVMVFLY